MQDKQLILEFARTEFTPAPGQASMDEFTLRLSAGEILMLRVEPGNEHLPLGDAALGLTKPARGRVLFKGADWRAIAPEKALKTRAHIGRVFNSNGWISNLDVIENITLARRHHTRQPVAEIEGEAQKLARAFGMREVPPGRPALVPRRDLRRAEWVRAFMGQPDFLCLERPGNGVATEHLASLIQAALNSCAMGGAVLWITDDEREIQAVGNAGNVRHCAMHGASLKINSLE